MFALCCVAPLALGGFGGYYGWLNRVLPGALPQAPMPAVNAFDTYGRALANFSIWSATTNLDAHVDTMGKREWEFGSRDYNRRYPLARKQAFLQRNARAFALLRQALDQPYVQPPERNAVFVAPYSRYRNLSRALLVEAHAHAQRGHWDKAADSLIDAMRFGHQIPHGGALAAGLTGIAIRTMAQRDFKFVLPYISAAKARECVRVLERLHDTRPTAADALREEKWAGQGFISQFNNTQSWDKLYAPDEISALEKARLCWMNKPRLLREHSRCIDWQIARCKRPYATADFMADAPWPFPDPVTGALSDRVKQVVYPKYQRWPLNVLLQDAKESLLLTLFSLRSYKLDREKYPSTLSELVPRYLARVPLDPFCDKPLRYHLRPVSFITREWNEILPQTGPFPQSPANLPVAVWPGYVRSRQSSSSVPFTLYSVGVDARNDNGIPWIRNFEPRYRADLRMFDSAVRGEKADIVAGINW